MKRAITILTLLVFLGPVTRAQTLTDANTSPQPGDDLDATYGSGPAITQTGANVTWDLSQLNSLEPEQYQFYAPQGTQWTSFFPSATVAESNGQGGHYYYEASANGFDYLGFGDPGGVLTCVDPMRFYQYPTSFGSAFTDPFSCSAVGTTYSGTLSYSAVGHGSLIMPYGTVENVLLIHRMDSMVITADTLTLNIQTTTVEFRKPGIHSWIVSGEADGSSLTWLNADAVGVQEALRNSIGLEVWPNPATDAFDLLYSATDGMMDLEVLDAQGRTVERRSIGGPLGVATEHVDTRTWPQGVYVLRVKDRAGERGVVRVAVQ